MRTVSARLLFVWLVFVGVATLTPLDETEPAADSRLTAQRATFQYGSYQRQVGDFLLNVALLVPAGALFQHACGHRARSRWTTVFAISAITAALSAAVEYRQAFLPQRDSSLVDVVANSTGAFVGAAADLAVGAALAAQFERVRSSLSPPILVGVLVSMAITSLLGSAAVQSRSRLSNWTAEYPLLIGNERTGDRAWRGTVASVEMTDAATPAEMLDKFAQGAAIELAGHSVAAFDMRGEYPYVDRAGTLSALQWTDGTGDGGVARFHASPQPWLQTEEGTAQLATRAMQTNAFSLRVRCAASDIHQSGRIVSNSFDPYHRNFTLGQNGRDLEFRLRTPATGTNGYPLQFVLRDVFSSPGTRDVVVTYDGSTVTVAAQGRGMMRAELTPGAIVALAAAEYKVDLRHMPVYQAAYLAVLFALPAAAVAVFGRDLRERLLFASIYVTGMSLLLEVALALTVGRSWHFHGAAVTFVVGATLFISATLLLAPGFRWRRRAHSLA